MTRRSNYKFARKNIGPYRSKYEKTIAEYLTSKKVKFSYETETFPYEATQKGTCVDCGSTDLVRSAKYTPDFVLPNGIYLETKGVLNLAQRRKILDFLSGNNSLTRENFRLLLIEDKWLSKAKATRYTDWCAKHGIVCAVGYEVPDEWLVRS